MAAKISANDLFKRSSESSVRCSKPRSNYPSPHLSGRDGIPLKINDDRPPIWLTCRKIVGLVFVAIFRRALCDEVARRETLLLALMLLLLLLLSVLVLLPLVAPLRVSEDIFGHILDEGIENSNIFFSRVTR